MMQNQEKEQPRVSVGTRTPLMFPTPEKKKNGADQQEERVGNF